jgi:3-dehydroquinate dehydratase/shikimate dehydrogenase
MRICASLGSADDLCSDDPALADLIEIRTDVFDRIPQNFLRKGQTGLITFKDQVREDIIPEGWIADVGTEDPSRIKSETISSYHDFDRTPEDSEILNAIETMKGDIVKGAFAVNSVEDLVRLSDLSQRIRKKHVVIGMGELGRITRIRSDLMRNEFTFAYVGKETAPGQMSVREMTDLGDDPMITGIVGHDIGYTRSPAMHDAAFRHLKIKGKYLVFDTPSLDRIGEMLLNYNVRGVNVTKPYKTDMIDHLDSSDIVSMEIGAVNAVVNNDGRLKGYNTDVFGIEKAFGMNSIEVDGKRALILGAGGAARSCAYFLSNNGCNVTITGRNENSVKEVASEFSISARERTSVAVKAYDIIVNCTPINMKNNFLDYPVRIEQIHRSQTVFDMVYGETHLTNMANKLGCTVIRGEDMLAYQGIRSFELFTSKKVPFEVMRDAV